MVNNSNLSFIACVGDAFVDMITYISEFPKSGEGVWGTPVKQIGGGCGANVASSLAKAGMNVGFYGRVGNDSSGTFLIDDFISRGVDIRGVVRDSQVSSGVVFIFVEPNGERTIIPCALGAAYTKVTPEDLAPLLKQPPAAVYFTGVLLGDEPSHSSIIGLANNLKGECTTYFDPNLRHPSWNIPPKIFSGMQELAVACDVILTGESELQALKLEPHDDQIFIVKSGDKGARLQTVDGTLAEVPAHIVNVIDATGAGDTFDAGFIAARMYGYTLEESLGIANAAGGLAVTIQGARAMADWSHVISLWKNTLKEEK